MDSSALKLLIEHLDDSLDDLEDALLPLTQAPLSETAGKLPLLDRAKLYVLTTYAIESILFSFIRLNGVNAREHAVYRELTRVKQYFNKIKMVEFGPVKRDNMALDRVAAVRMVKHALSGNVQLDPVKGQQQKNLNGATHIRFEDSSQLSKKRKT